MSENIKLNYESNFSDPLSYKTIRNLAQQFRRSNGSSGSDFNAFETPGHYYFKLMFYFNNPGGDDDYSSNLLGCDWITNEFNENKQPLSNTAYNYLMLNDEKERAEKLKKFIYLLSDINSQSPWYFTSITGLDTALERKILTERDFKIEDNRKQISIKCLPDAYDSRIGTLLDLYRSICYSYTNKKEIIPANLRKFDMGIYIFNTVQYNCENGNEEYSTYPYISANSFSNDILFRSSSKYIELHNCEIDYNSSKSVYGDLNNQDGKQNEYEIIIYFDDAYENRYNEFITEDIGDFIKPDLIETSKNETEYDMNYYIDYNSSETIQNQRGFFQSRYGNTYIGQNSEDAHKRKVNDLTIKKDKNIFTNMTNQITGHVEENVKSLVKSVYLGNMYGLSLSEVKDQVKDLMSGNIFNTVNAIQDYAEQANKNKGKPESLDGRKLYSDVKDWDNGADGISGRNIFDVDRAKNDIIKRGQKSQNTNIKRSLFQ